MGYPTTAEMQARALPKCAASNIATPTDDTDHATRQMAAMDEYLARFLPPNGKCVCCDSMLGGILGTFEWGIVNGQGKCGLCGWPARAYHTVNTGGDDIRITLILQYHPDELMPERSSSKEGEP